MSGSGPARIDTSHIKSPRDPMTLEEREAVRRELRAEMQWVDEIIQAHGDPWSGIEPDWGKFDDEDAA